MRKIFSFLLAVAIVFSFAAVTYAADVTITIGENAAFDASEIADGTYFTIPVYFSALPASGTITAISIDFEYDPAVLTPSTNAKGNANFWAAVQQVMNWDTELPANATYSQSITSAQKLFTVSFLDSTGGNNCFERDYGFDPSVAMGTLKLKKVAGATGETVVKVKAAVITDVNSTQTTGSQIDCGECVITLSADKPDAKEVAMTAEPFISAVGHTEDTEAGWQAGQAVVLQFNPADLKDFAAMAWKIKCNGKTGYLYAPVKAEDFATLKSCGVNTDVFASFVINESKETKEKLYTIEEVTAEFGKTGETEPWVAVWSN